MQKSGKITDKPLEVDIFKGTIIRGATHWRGYGYNKYNTY
jgi:hypothetical protein